MTRGIQVLAWSLLLIAPLAAQAPGDRGQQAQLARVERALLVAVNSGAQTMLQQVRQVAPQLGYMLSGAPDVTGFRLDGYGVFFHVRVPMIRPTFALALRLDPRAQLLSGRGTRVSLPGGSPEAVTVGAPPAAPFIDPELLRDPEGFYTREVQQKLIDTMLESSRGLVLAPDNVLTVAARDNTPLDLLDPADGEVHTVEFTIKGRDLAAYHAGTISLDEARHRVVLTEK